MGNSPRDCGPGGQLLGFNFIWSGIVLMGSCSRTPGHPCPLPSSGKLPADTGPGEVSQG